MKHGFIIALTALGAIGFGICGNYAYTHFGLAVYILAGLSGISGWAFGTGWAIFNLGQEKKVVEKEDKWALP